MRQANPNTTVLLQVSSTLGPACDVDGQARVPAGCVVLRIRQPLDGAADYRLRPNCRSPLCDTDVCRRFPLPPAGWSWSCKCDKANVRSAIRSSLQAGGVRRTSRQEGLEFSTTWTPQRIMLLLPSTQPMPVATPTLPSLARLTVARAQPPPPHRCPVPLPSCFFSLLLVLLARTNQHPTANSKLGSRCCRPGASKLFFSVFIPSRWWLLAFPLGARASRMSWQRPT